ncbi:MAG: hypothetical protein BWY09_02808 [Candidatus Hydrogenedentes bacterium ADurb.Bin179]|nr:MAG: hypothetical protein BWY09_02808 [Candidatus Hydrogenedentes bacterium ADurb.Bin179]
MSLPLAVRLVVALPETDITPLCVSAPPLCNTKGPPDKVTLPRSSAPESRRLACHELIVTVPLNVFSALFSVIVLPEMRLDVPPTDNEPFWRIELAQRVRLPLIFEAPRVITQLLPKLLLLLPRKLTLLPDTTVTAPVKSLSASFNVILLAEPTVRLVAPPTTKKASFCVTFPPVCTVRPPLTVDAPSSKAFVSRRLTSFPETMETAPVKSLEA